MSPAEAQAIIPERKAQLRAAYQAYVDARKALERARDDLYIAALIAKGEFEPDCPDEYEVSYYGLVRKVDPTPARCHAIGSQGPYSWQT